MKKNQNVELVNSPAKADYCPYLNYVKDRKGGKTYYIFTWLRELSEFNQLGSLMMSSNNVAVKDFSSDNKMNSATAKKITDLLRPVLRAKTDQWLNQWPRK